MAKTKQTFTAADVPAPETAAPFTAAPEPERVMPETAPEPVVEEVAPPTPVPQPEVPAALTFPKGFLPMDSVPKDGRTLRMWFGTGPAEMGTDYFALARWRRSREWSPKDHGWVETGFWVRPATNLKIECDFRAWAAAGQVTQEDIDASNFAVNQENERRRKALEAKQTKTDAERAAS